MTTSILKNADGETFEVGDIVAFSDNNTILHYTKGDLVRVTALHLYDASSLGGHVDFEHVRVADPLATDTEKWPIGWFTKRNGLEAWRAAVAAGQTTSSFDEWSRVAIPRGYSIGLPVSILVDHATGSVTFDVDLSEASDLAESQPDTDDFIEDDNALVSDATATVGHHFTFTLETKA